VFPFLNGIFASPMWNPAAEHYFRGTLTRFEMPDWGWTSYLLFPFRITLKPRIMDVHTGIVPLLLIPLAFVRGLPRAAGPLRVFLLGSVVAWLAIQTEVRSLLTCFAVLAVVGAAAAEVHLLGRAGLRRAVLALLAAAVAANLVVISVTAIVTFDPFRYLVGLESGSGYLLRTARAHDVYDCPRRPPGRAPWTLLPPAAGGLLQLLRPAGRRVGGRRHGHDRRRDAPGDGDGDQPRGLRHRRVAARARGRALLVAPRTAGPLRALPCRRLHPRGALRGRDRLRRAAGPVKSAEKRVKSDDGRGAPGSASIFSCVT
jgi:hypothetical protein